MSEEQLKRSIEESLAKYGAAHPFAVINHAKLETPPAVKDHLQDGRMVQLVDTDGWEVDQAFA